MSVDKGIVIEGISVKNLGRQPSETQHNNHSPLLRFDLGGETCKTSTKKHVGHDIFWEDETLRFKSARDADTLTITALHRRAVFTHSKKFIGQARVPVKNLGPSNTITLKSSAGRDAGVVSFNIKGVVPLAAVAELVSGEATADVPKEEPKESTTEALAAENAGSKTPEPAPEVLPLMTEITTTTTRSKRTTTTTITDTAHILHEKAPEEDAEAHMLIEAGKQKLLEDQAERQLARKPAQGQSVMLTFGVLCKLLLASYLAFLDVIMTRAVEFMGRPHLAPRRLLQMDTLSSKSSFKSPAAATGGVSPLSPPAPTKAPSILQKTEAEVLEQPQEHATPAAAIGMPHDAQRLDTSEHQSGGSGRLPVFGGLADDSERTEPAGITSSAAGAKGSKAAEAESEPSTPPAGITSKFSDAEPKVTVEDSARKSQGALKSVEE